MPYYIGGVTADAQELVIRTPTEFLRKNQVVVKTRHRVENIDHGARTVLVRDLEGGTEFRAPYTRLLIATGADAFVPDLEGSRLKAVFTLRKLIDSIRIKDFIERSRPANAVIVGGGPIGMEMCEALRKLGIGVTVVEMAPHIMPGMDEELASLVLSTVEDQGVECMTGTKVEALLGGKKGAVSAVATSAGEVPASLVVLAIGIRPSVKLASDAGLEFGAGRAILVDKAMKTSLEDVYAAGDCATTTNRVTGRDTWFPLASTARKQGRVAGEAMFGGDSSFPGIVGTSIVKVFDTTVGKTGLSEGEALEAGFDAIVVEIEALSHHEYYHYGGKIHLRMTVDKGSRKLLGAQLVGDWNAGVDRRLDVFAVALTAGMEAPDLQYLDLAYSPPYSTGSDVEIIAGNLAQGKLGGPGCSCNEHGLSD